MFRFNGLSGLTKKVLPVPVVNKKPQIVNRGFVRPQWPVNAAVANNLLVPASHGAARPRVPKRKKVNFLVESSGRINFGGSTLATTAPSERIKFPGLK